MIKMKCSKCGFEYEDSLQACPNCEPVSQLEKISLNPAVDKVGAAITSGLFLTICILMTTSIGFSLLAGNLPIINILLIGRQHLLLRNLHSKKEVILTF